MQATGWTVAQAVENLKVDGFFVLPNPIDGKLLRRFTQAYEAVFNLPEPFVHIVKLDNGHLYNAPKSTLSKFEGFDAFGDLFHSGMLADVAHTYMQCFFDYGFDQINQVFEVERNDRNGSTNGSPLHFDMVPSLKTFIYLDEIRQGNGATRVLPGSHIQARKFALRHFQSDCNPLTSDSFLCDPERYHELHIEGGPGTVFFVDTYCIHGGGIVSNQRGRRSVRAVTWARPLNQDYFLHRDFAEVTPPLDYSRMRFFNPTPGYAGELPEHDRGSLFRMV